MTAQMVSLSDLASILKAHSTVGLDTETTGLDPYTAELATLQIATTDGHVYVADVRGRLLPPDLFSEVGLVVCHNCRFDGAFVVANGARMPARFFDTYLASKVTDGGVHTNQRVVDPTGRMKRGKPVKWEYHSLAALAYRELDVVLDKTEQLFFVEDPHATITPELLEYAALDAAVLLPLVKPLADKIEAYGLEMVWDIEMRALPAFIWMYLNGMPIDVECWKGLRDEALSKLQEAESTIQTVAPGLNPNSPSQVRERLSERGINVPNAQADTLKLYAGTDSLIDALIEQSKWEKLAGTYGDGYLKHVNEVTGKIHSNLKQIGADTGRSSGTSPNLQNIPRDSAYRACFRDGSDVLIKADYSQIELRIAALVAGDQDLIALFERGDDVHTATARAVMGREPDAGERQKAKAVNFGFFFGMGAPKFVKYAHDSYGVDIPLREAQRFKKILFTQVAPGIKKWHWSIRDGMETVRTLSGRARFRVTRYTEKLNTPVQGTGADILKLALASLWERRAEVPRSVRPVLVVHDEIVVQSPLESADIAVEWVTKAMLDAAQLIMPGVRVEVEAKIATNWSGKE